MGPQGAINISFSAKSWQNPTIPKPSAAELVQHYTEHFASPYVAASRGYVQDIIEPKTTRSILIDALETLDVRKRVQRPNRKHGNIPL